MDPNLIAGALMGAVVVGFLITIRTKDLPQPAPVSPYRHLDERKAAIYESLRDLQFEYRLNKLSDEDYRLSKLQLQKELARVLEETDKIKSGVKVIPIKQGCQKCGATFDKSPKFCPECGAAQ